MPKPSTIPSHLDLEAQIAPPAGGTMHNHSGKVVNCKLFCTERMVSAFKVEEHRETGIIISAKGYQFTLSWNEATRWQAVAPAPERIRTQPWVRPNARCRYVGGEPLVARSNGVVFVSANVAPIFTVEKVFARHMVVKMEGVVGSFDVTLEGGAMSNWQPITDNHDPRVNILTGLKPTSRIMPIDLSGKRIGHISYLVTEVNENEYESIGGWFEICALLGDGVRGPIMRMPRWNSGLCWAFAPDDPSHRQLQVGDIVTRNGYQARVVSVDEITKRVRLERVVQEDAYLTDPGIEVETPVREDSGQTRFERESEV